MRKRERQTHTHSEEEAEREERAHREEIENNPMKLLEVIDRDT